MRQRRCGKVAGAPPGERQRYPEQDAHDEDGRDEGGEKARADHPEIVVDPQKLLDRAEACVLSEHVGRLADEVIEAVRERERLYTDAGIHSVPAIILVTLFITSPFVARELKICDPNQAYTFGLFRDAGMPAMERGPDPRPRPNRTVSAWSSNVCPSRTAATPCTDAASSSAL